MPKKFAVAGLLIGLTIVGLWWIDVRFNPFGLPSWPQAPPNYSAPLAYRIFEDSIFVFCPAALLQVFTIGIGGWLSWIIWFLCALLNMPIYYGVGFLLESLSRRGSAHRMNG